MTLHGAMAVILRYLNRIQWLWQPTTSRWFKLDS